MSDLVRKRFAAEAYPRWLEEVRNALGHSNPGAVVALDEIAKYVSDFEDHYEDRAYADMESDDN